MEAEQNEAKLRQELRKAQALASEALDKYQAAEEAKMKKIQVVKDLKRELATALQQVESGKLQIQQLSGLLAKTAAATGVSGYAGKR
jgi:2-polyprenyl-6-methoxyphenol hydroxylase-like FAD-dependent oxidoreductase